MIKGESTQNIGHKTKADIIKNIVNVDFKQGEMIENIWDKNYKYTLDIGMTYE